MTELPIQITRLPVHPQVRPSIKPANTNSNATGNEGFKLSILTSAKPDRHCCLMFRNFYVAWIRIVQVNVDGSSTELASNYPLMQHVHCEDDAQNWQLIKLEKLPVSWNPHVLDSLCVYLSQPSPLWEVWEVREVKLYILPQELEAKGGDDTISLKPSSPEKKTSIEWASPAEDRHTELLDHRRSRSALVRNSVAVDTTPIEEHVTRCLDIVLRLRELLQN